MGTATIGVAGTATVPSSGDFFGTVTLGGSNGSLNTLGNTASLLDLLKIYGSVTGGLIDINGNGTAIDIAHSFTHLDAPMVVQGNLSSFTVGSDPASSGDSLAANLTVDGNLGTGLVTGALTGVVLVQGNVSKFTVNNDSVTQNTNLFTGDLNVGGTLTNVGVQGRLGGNIRAGFLGTSSFGGDLAGQVIGGKGVSLPSRFPAALLLAGASRVRWATSRSTHAHRRHQRSCRRPQLRAIASISFNGSVTPTGSIEARNLGGDPPFQVRSQAR